MYFERKSSFVSDLALNVLKIKLQVNVRRNFMKQTLKREFRTFQGWMASYIWSTLWRIMIDHSCWKLAKVTYHYLYWSQFTSNCLTSLMRCLRITKNLFAVWYGVDIIHNLWVDAVTCLCVKGLCCPDNQEHRTLVTLVGSFPLFPKQANILFCVIGYPP